MGPTIPCPLESITGLECAFCGATRATRALLDGHVAEAFNLNVLFCVLVIVGLVALASAVFLPRPLRGVLTGRLGNLDRSRVVRVGAALLVAWTVARNLPWLPALAAG